MVEISQCGLGVDQMARFGKEGGGCGCCGGYLQLLAVGGNLNSGSPAFLGRPRAPRPHPHRWTGASARRRRLPGGGAARGRCRGLPGPSLHCESYCCSV